METVLSEEAVHRLLLKGCQHTSFTESTWPLHQHGATFQSTCSSVLTWSAAHTILQVVCTATGAMYRNTRIQEAFKTELMAKLELHFRPKSNG